MILILVSALLVVLVSLALVLGSLQGQGRGVAQAGVGAARAALLARSGVEYGMSRISRAPDPDPRPGAYRDDWTCRDGAGVRLEDLRNPSYHHGEAWDDAPTGDGRYTPADGWGAADDLDGNGRYSGWTGRLRGAYGRADTFALRIEDESGKINVNGGVLGGGVAEGWNGQLQRVLDVLGSVREDANGDAALDPGEDWNGNGILDPPPVGIAGLGGQVLGLRPSGGYGSIRALQAALGTDVDLSPYLTTGSWIDAKVVRPNARPGEMSQWALASVKRERGLLGIETGGRPPVNLNVASHPVLIALLQDLRCISAYPQADRFLTLVPCQEYAIQAPMASAIAGAMTDYREGRDPAGLFAAAGLSPGVFDNWREFELFCDALVPSVINGMPGNGGNESGADLLKANFNPNTRLNKQLPDQLMWRYVDKSDLLLWSTEGSLGPTGRFRVASLGRVVDPRGEVLASSKVEQMFDAFFLLRQTTQEDFVGGRGLADAPRYVSGSTAGRTAGADAAWLGDGQGLAVQTYPNPMTVLPTAAAPYDGSIALATVEIDRSAALPSAASQWRFLHHFDDGWGADYSADASGRPRIDGPSDTALQGDAAVEVWPAPPEEPGTLYPDGMHTQRDRAPAFDAHRNLPGSGRRAVLGYWAKPYSTRIAVEFSCFRFVGGRSQAVEVAGWQSWTGSWTWGAVIENALSFAGAGNDLTSTTLRNGERQVRLSFPARKPDLQWTLVSIHWDFDEEDPAIDPFDLRVIRQRSDGTGSGTKAYPPLDASAAEDLTRAGLPFVLGGQLLPAGDPSYPPEIWVYSNAVLDDVSICDFGDAGAAAQFDLDAWHAGRWLDGRYYRGGDGTYVSPVLVPGSGAPVRVLRANWSELVPRDTRLELELLSSAAAPATLASLTQGGNILRDLDSFRYRVRFRTDLPAGNPLLETPWFDDITFSYRPLGVPRILAWEVGT